MLVMIIECIKIVCLLECGCSYIIRTPRKKVTIWNLCCFLDCCYAMTITRNLISDSLYSTSYVFWYCYSAAHRNYGSYPVVTLCQVRVAVTQLTVIS